MDSHCVMARFMDETCALRVFVVSFSLHTDRWERLRLAPVSEVPSGSASHREDAKSAKGRGDLAGAGHHPSLWAESRWQSVFADTRTRNPRRSSLGWLRHGSARADHDQPGSLAKAGILSKSPRFPSVQSP